MQKYPKVFSRECLDRLVRLKEQYGEKETHQVIYETVLTESEATCDISFRVDTGRKPVANYWLEFDYAVYAQGNEAALTPCRFIDASCLKPKRDSEEVRVFLEQDLTELIGQDKAVLFTSPLLELADKLEGKCPALFQVGSMDSRATRWDISCRESSPTDLMPVNSAREENSYEP